MYQYNQYRNGYSTLHSRYSSNYSSNGQTLASCGMWLWWRSGQDADSCGKRNLQDPMQIPTSTTPPQQKLSRFGGGIYGWISGLVFKKEGLLECGSLCGYFLYVLDILWNLN